ncbi:MAG: glutamate--tRNA ligase [bacterium]|nr:glutamate--tRNA ligase [bacterium]
MNVRVRFAPSPTGELHIGGLRTALYDFLFAKKHNGTFVLRIDDTDRTRYVEGAEERLTQLLEQFEIIADESPQTGGPFAPYRQSERLQLYKQAIETLLQNGAVYRCFCTPDRINAVQAVRKAQKLPPRYDRHCRNLSIEESNKLADTQPYTIRIAIPDRDILVEDQLRGTIVFKAGATDDAILIKTDGFPTYHLATVVDDYEMKISDVIRGEEWLPSLPIHKTIADGLNIQLPNFYHIGLLVDETGKKLSKRTGGAEVREWLEKGISKQAIVNAVVRLGWDAGTPELLTMEQLIQKFELIQVSPHAAIVSENHFDHFSREFIKKAEISQLLDEFPKLQKFTSKPDFTEVLSFAREEASDLKEFYQAVNEWYNLKEIKTITFEENLPTELKVVIQQTDFQQVDPKDWLSNLSKQTGLKGKNLWLPLRKKLTGKEHGPEIIRIIQFLGLERVKQLLTAE